MVLVQVDDRSFFLLTLFPAKLLLTIIWPPWKLPSPLVSAKLALIVILLVREFAVRLCALRVHRMARLSFVIAQLAATNSPAGEPFIFLFFSISKFLYTLYFIFQKLTSSFLSD